MADAYALYALTARGCVAKVVCGSHHDGQWSPISLDVYCALRWLDVDSSLHAYVQLSATKRALVLAMDRMWPSSALHAELRDLHQRVVALERSPPMRWCGEILERVRTGPRTALESEILAVTGLG